MRGLFRKERMWPKHELKPRYDVVIIGAGVHGLSTAYYLAKNHGITNVAVLDKVYLGGGNSGRNTAILRANYMTPEGIRFYSESLRLYEGLSKELDYNLLMAQVGHISLAHTDSAVNGIWRRAEVNKAMGVDSRMIYPDEIKEKIPALDMSQRPRYPIKAGLYHPPGGMIRHNAVVWGYARAAERYGAEIHTRTEVTGIDVKEGQVEGVRTAAGEVIRAGVVVNSTAGYCSTVAKMAGVDLPVVTHPLQACVTEPLKPFLDVVTVSANLHVYVYQTDRGELVLGSEIDPYSSYAQVSTLETLESIVGHAIELFPSLKNVRILRQWTGICDMTPDYSPIMGDVDGLKGFVLDVGWGTYGFKAGPVSGKRIAEFIGTGKMPDLIAPFRLSRFYDRALVSERGAAAVSH
ncbi:MAG: FAD-binding oxidoreductase [Thaumarchaeota archaeon]|nr:FAD-binding oxidoreductase [Nitrososphaerota archaeon]